MANKKNNQHTTIELEENILNETLLPSQECCENGKTKFVNKNKLLQFFYADEYQKFKKAIKNTKKPSFLTKTSLECDTLKTIISSENGNSAKYVSLILKTFDLWNDEKYFEQENLMNPKNVENLFSLLMFDWFNTSPMNKNYCLVLKAEQFLNLAGETLSEKLYKIIDDEQFKIYRDVCLHLIYQLITELIEREKSSEDIEKLLSYEKALKVEDVEYREKVLQVLLVVMTKPNENESIYNEIKEKMTSSLSAEVSSYFNLVFLLKDEKVAKFEKSFIELMENYTRLCGDYSVFAMKPLVRLLNETAKQQKIKNVQDFIVMKFPQLKSSSNIMENMNEIQKLNVFNVFPIKSEDLNQTLNEIKTTNELGEKCLGEIKTLVEMTEINSELKDFLFGRFMKKNGPELSVFEKILSSKKSSELILLIWEKFELYKVPEILNNKNPSGKLLINFVLDSNDNSNLLKFLVPTTNLHSNSDVRRAQHYMMLKNMQLKMIIEKSLLEICAENINAELEAELFIAMFSLLEETARFRSVKEDFPIEKVLNLATEDVESKLALYELIGLVTSYWKPSDENFAENKQKLLNLNPIFSMIFDVIENEEKFFNEFFANQEKFEEFLDKMAQAEIQQWKSKFSFILLLTAMKNDRLKVIEFILSNDPSVMDHLRFPLNIELRESSFHFALKSLEHGYDISTEQIPSSWISPKVFKKFLDSKIKFDGGDLVELDCSFLIGRASEEIPSHDDLLFKEPTKCLDHIVKSEALVSSITHPVIATFIELKSSKYRGIYKWNFWLFIIFFMIPFGSLVFSHFFMKSISNPSDSLYFWIQLIIEFIGLLSIIFLFFNEYFRYRFIDQSLKIYLNRNENRLRIALVIVAFISYILIFLSKNKPVTNFFVFFLIFLAVLELIVIYPLPSSPLHQIMMKKNTIAVFKILPGLIVFMIVSSMVFKMIDPNIESYRANSTDELNDTQILTNFNEENAKEREFKFIIEDLNLPSGELNDFKDDANSTEPDQGYTQASFDEEKPTDPKQELTDEFQEEITILAYTLISVIVVLRIVYQDFSNLTTDLKYFLSMKVNAANFIRRSQQCLMIYEMSRYERNQSYLMRCAMSFLKDRLSVYPNIHRIDKICVNLKTQELNFIYGNFFNHKKAKRFLMDKETLRNLKKIIFLDVSQ